MPETTQAQEDSAPPPEADGTASSKRTLRWLLAAAFLHGLAYLLLLPPWMGEDEPWHLEYAHHVGAGHMPWGGREVSRDDLPQFSPSQAFVVRELGGLEPDEVREAQRRNIDSMREHGFWERVDWADWSGGVENFDQVAPYFTATHQPPFYYLVTGQVLRLFGGGDLLRELWIERGLALLAYLAVVLAAFELGKRVSSDANVALLCALLVAWWPMHARQAGVVNNDVLVKVASAWTLVLALDLARFGLTRRRLLFALALAGIGLAVKTTAAGVLVPLGLALLWRGARSEAFGTVKVRVTALAVIVAMMGVVVVAYRSSNNPAIPRTLASFESRLQNALAPGFRQEFARTAVGAFNWYSRNLPTWLYSAVGYSLAAAAIGLLVAWSRRLTDFRRGLATLCLAGCASQLLLVFLRGTAAGRYVMPMLPAFALLAALGFLMPFPARRRASVLAIVALALLAFDGYFAWAGLTWNQYGVWGS